MAELDDGLQLVSRVVGVLNGVAGLIGDAGQIAGAVVSVDDRGRVGISRLSQALAGVVGKMSGVAAAVGLRGAIAGVVVGIAGGAGFRCAVAAGDGDEAVVGVVGVAGGAAVGVGLADFAAGCVVGVAGDALV